MPKDGATIECYLGLGSNLNNPQQQLQKAIKHLNRLNNLHTVKVARFYQSKAWGVTDQADFVNTVIKVCTSLSPHALLKQIKIIEYRLMQRQINQRWHSRIIDIDILVYGHKVINRSELVIPHPLISERCFVVQPLLELNPTLSNKLLKQIHSHKINHNCLTELTPLNPP